MLLDEERFLLQYTRCPLSFSKMKEGRSRVANMYVLMSDDDDDDDDDVVVVVAVVVAAVDVFVVV